MSQNYALSHAEEVHPHTRTLTCSLAARSSAVERQSASPSLSASVPAPRHGPSVMLPLRPLFPVIAATGQRKCCSALELPCSSPLFAPLFCLRTSNRRRGAALVGWNILLLLLWRMGEKQLGSSHARASRTVGFNGLDQQETAASYLLYLVATAQVSRELYCGYCKN
jgi:hypothetical protein